MAPGYFLGRSEHPPAPPLDWAQPVKIGCNCTDCRELQAFIRDPAEEECRFRVRKERRQHLHQQIDRTRLDMTHVTERKGSPQTLVYTKTRATYQRACNDTKPTSPSFAAWNPSRRPANPAMKNYWPGFAPRSQGMSQSVPDEAGGRGKSKDAAR